MMDNNLQAPKRNYRPVLVAGLSIAAAIVVLVFAYRYAVQFYAQSQYTKYMSEGSAEYASSDYDGAVSAYLNAAKVGPTSLDVNRAQYELAATYVTQGDDESKSSAAQLFKSLALNSVAPPTLRAYSYAQLGFMAVDPALAQKFVFNDEPFISILNAVDNSRVDAQAELFRRSDALYPTPAVEYKLAYLQAIRVSRESGDVASTTSAQVKNYAVATYLLLQNADALLAKQPITNYAEATTAKISRARTLVLLSPYIPSITPALINSSYSDALVATQNAPDVTTTQGSVRNMQILLEYAAALSPAVAHASADVSHINKLLAEYLDYVSAAPDAASKAAMIINHPDDYPNIARQLAYFAKVSPSFADYLHKVTVAL